MHYYALTYYIYMHYTRYMSLVYNKLKREQAAEKLAKIEPFGDIGRPSTGWIRYVRRALSMTATQLAQRLGVVQSSVSRMEKGERAESITLKSLRKVADSMDCDLVYALVPRRPIKRMLEEKAREKAIRDFDRVEHSMSLEQQGTDNAYRLRRIEEETKRLLEESPNDIWDT